MTSQKLTERQPRWSLLLTKYDFILNHQPEVQNNKVDHLSWRPNHGRGVENNNSYQILLRPEYFFH